MYEQDISCAIMAHFGAFYLQDSKQFSNYTQARCKFTVARIDKRENDTDLDILKMEAQETFGEKFTENDKCC